MDVPIDFDSITNLLTTAHGKGRESLYEYEVYSLLSQSGAETPPKCNFIPRGSRPSDETLISLPGEKAVLKIICSTIIHKTEVGGVRIVNKDSNSIRSAVRRMFSEVPANYTEWIEKNPDLIPETYKGLAGDALTAAISKD
ncbi:MAG: CoA-binding protein, partial [Desulfobacteraceae bacterium]|nr:CoA-binding protein [Desulfobacteraceae bacterium]